MRPAAALGLMLALGAPPAAAYLPDASDRPLARPGAGPVAAEIVPHVPLAPVYYDATIRPAPRPADGTAASPGASPAPRPVPSGDEAAGAVMLVPVQYRATIRPHPRPLQAATPEEVIEVPSGVGLVRSARPEPRPEVRLAAAAAAVRTQPSTVTRGKSGAICGDRAIRGETLAPIPGRIRGCGVERPVRVTSVDGVALVQPATMDCDTARALNTWVQQGVKPAVGRLGGGVASLKVVASYACRTRNNRPGGKISEHGKGRAVDVAAINLKNGIALTVLKGWNHPVQGRLLRRMHKAACGPFGTVLGPGSDGYHRDHFHFDTARYRSGPYCR